MNKSNATEKKIRLNFLLLIIPLCLIIAYFSSTTFNAKKPLLPESRTLPELEFSVRNKYNLLYGDVGTQYPWINFPVVEPHQETKLQVKEYGDDYDYIWTIKGETNLTVTVLTGSTVSYAFKELKYFFIEVVEVLKGTSEVLRVANKKVVCRYVRREIRSLTDDDRNTFFSAMETLITLPNLEGKAKYGEKYNDWESFVMLHNIRAGDPVCDHMHDGYGFIFSHAALTLAFEQSLQSINPTISIPYWDYTIDTENMKSMNGDVYDWYDSIIFDDDWFGEANPSGKVVTNGRFSYIPVKRHMYNVSSVHNAYGLLRAPWNQNKIPYVTRSSGVYGFKVYDLPSCDHHYDLLQMSSFGVFGASVPYAPHGAVHIALGGIWGANWVSHLEEWGYNMTIAKSWGDIAFSKQKNIFRSRVLQCPNFCSFDTSNEDCLCYCPDFEDYLKDEELLQGLIDLTFSESTSKYNVGLLNLLCNGYDDLVPVTGDNLESASPADPSFWPIHPTVDRLFQWKRINGFDEMHWLDDAAWSVNGYGIGYCKGHNIDDVIGFSDLFNGKSGPYTNRDILQLLNPENDLSPYVYDQFTWEHCSLYPSNLIGGQ